MRLFLYANERTFLHRLDPRTKFLAMVIAFIMILLWRDIPFLAVLLALAVTALLWGRCQAQLKLMLLPLAVLFITTIFMWSAFNRFTWAGTLYGLAMSLRLGFILLIGILLLATTRLEDITSALLFMGVPYTLSFSFSLALRLLPTFINTTTTIIEAQKSRGLDLNSKNPWERVKRYVPLLVPILSCAFRQVDLLAMALESRGFGVPVAKKSIYTKLGFKSADYLVTGIIIVGFIGLVILRWK